MLRLNHAIAQTARQSPDRIAVRFQSDEVTYQALDSQSGLVADFLAARGVVPGDRVAVHLRRGPALIPAISGVLGAGAAFVPIDAETPGDRARWIIEDCGARIVLTDSEISAEYRSTTTARAFAIEAVLAESRIAGPGSAPPPQGHPAELAYVLYTSGSTGRPKGVGVATEALDSYLSWALPEYRMAEGSGAPLFTSIGFDATLTTLLGPLLAGSTVWVIPEHDAVSELARLLSTGPDFSFVKATPHHVRLLTELIDRRAPNATRRLIVGGDVLPGEVVRRWMQICPVPVVNEYGPTETVVGCTTYTVLPDEADALGADVPIGAAIGTARAHVLTDVGVPAAPGEMGEIFIGGPCAQNRYVGQPELTAQKFVPDPFGEPGARMYRTGDLARLLPNGELEFHGRRDKQVKVRGIRLELGEVEAHLRACPGVTDAAVVTWNDGETVVGAAVVGRDPAEVSAWLRDRVPGHAIPNPLVRVPAMPINQNAKTDLAAVLELVRGSAPVPSPRTLDAPADGGAGHGGLLDTLVTEISQVLGGIAVTPLDDFFALGGDSMSGLRLVARLRKSGLVLSPRDIVEYPTPTALAQAMAGRAAPAPAERGLIVGDVVAMTHVQREFLALGLPDPSHWNQAMLLKVPAGISRERIERAVLKVASWHEVLHYRYRHTSEGWQQAFVGGSPAVVVQEFAPGEAGFPDLTAVVRSANAALDLGDGPLARIALVRGETADHLLLVAHHLIVDEVSWITVLDDLAAEFRRTQANGPGDDPQSAPPTGFARWSRELRVFGERAEVRSRRAYWTAVLDSAAGELPTDTSATDDYGFEQHERGGLSRTETADLQHAAKAANVHVDELLLGAAVSAICETFGIKAPRVDVESHGRADLGGELDVSRTMGWLTAVFPVLLDSGDGRLGLVRSARDVLRDLPWAGLDFGVLAEAEGWSTRERAQVLFNFLGEQEREVAPDLGWSLVELPVDALAPPSGPRPYRLELQARVRDGVLAWDWKYGRCHTAQTAQRLSTALRQTLGALVEELHQDTIMRFDGSGLSAGDLAEVLGAISALPQAEQGRA